MLVYVIFYVRDLQPTIFQRHKTGKIFQFAKTELLLSRCI